MSAVAQVPVLTPSLRVPAAAAEQRFVLHDVTWQSYAAIGAALADRSGLHLTYDRGSLEFMTLSPRHERLKYWFGRFVETIAEEVDISIAPYCCMTMQKEGLQRGLEPDQCYWIEHEHLMRGKDEWDPERDPLPDLAIEIKVSRSALDRLSIYAALSILEVWCFDGEALRIYHLQADQTYQLSDRSRAFPTLPLAGITPFLQSNASLDYLSVVRAFRTWLREQLAGEKA